MGDVEVSEKPQDAQGLPVQRLHGPEQRGLFVQGFAAVGAEGRRDAQHLALDKSVGGGVPGGVASRLKGGAQPAGGEGARVRFPADELLAGKLHDDAAVGRRRDKAVMLLRRHAGEGLEPVGKVGCAVLHGPVAHGGGNSVCHLGIKRLALFHGLLHGVVDLAGKAGFHGAVVKYKTAEGFRYGFHILHPFKIKKETTTYRGTWPSETSLSQDAREYRPVRELCQVGSKFFTDLH